MRPDDHISEWTRARAVADVPPGFVDRVVTAATSVRRRRVLQIVAVGLASIVGAARIAAALAVFFPQ